METLPDLVGKVEMLQAQEKALPGGLIISTIRSLKPPNEIS